jgi:hypothetical protein
VSGMGHNIGCGRGHGSFGARGGDWARVSDTATETCDYSDEELGKGRRGVLTGRRGDNARCSICDAKARNIHIQNVVVPAANGAEDETHSEQKGAEGEEWRQDPALVMPTRLRPSRVSPRIHIQGGFTTNCHFVAYKFKSSGLVLT